MYRVSCARHLGCAMFQHIVNLKPGTRHGFCTEPV